MFESVFYLVVVYFTDKAGRSRHYSREAGDLATAWDIYEKQRTKAGRFVRLVRYAKRYNDPTTYCKVLKDNTRTK